MVVVLVCEEDDLGMICGYAPQSAWHLEEIECFYHELNNELDIHSVDELVVYLSELNGYMDGHMHEFMVLIEGIV